MKGITEMGFTHMTDIQVESINYEWFVVAMNSVYQVVKICH